MVIASVAFLWFLVKTILTTIADKRKRVDFYFNEPKPYSSEILIMQPVDEGWATSEMIGKRLLVSYKQCIQYGFTLGTGNYQHQTCYTEVVCDYAEDGSIILKSESIYLTPEEVTTWMLIAE